MNHDAETYAAGVRAGQRHVLSRALTLIESVRPADRVTARRLLELLGPGGTAHRIGISGVPGGGKSTLIDTLGRHLIAAGHRVAVLAVDPSSRRTGGSILGDRTRMAGLGAHREAFIRPTPSSGALGGVADSTHDVLTVVEAAGYDVILVETVGVGQSETAVADLVDTFLLVTVTGTGDGLQAIKMGVLEWADVVAVTKADGANVTAARSVARELGSALRLAHRGSGDPPPAVLTCSATEPAGIAELWAALREHHERGLASGTLEARRRHRRVVRLRAGVRDALLRPLAADPEVAAVEDEVRRGTRTPEEGADLIVAAVRRRMRE
ncbi:methylmalonyl Co-A mutase-associated GTPase MeaB [Actinoplanes regularis]|uniref:LAO/AO transport system kinase n=1 Tax=Actinoplanes regularis TaxID=52697 RepID=A0A239IJF7_9ACTN|nr:methylmalonyl Co-A mutase-associated GTPase MeaB [Actinoplanes regularis]GIE91516.1 ATPase/protein kinase [Actinoplanes regularis]SNS93669.1 LAO/AO transport system kinase [Actinoplanes regularis]